jgi:hypothetical protein
MENKIDRECGTYGELRSSYRILTGKRERKRALGGHQRRWENHIKMDAKEMNERKWARFIWLKIGKKRNRFL